MALFQPNFTHTHVLNNYTHVDHFWCLISKYTEYMAQIPLGSLRLDSTRLDTFDVSSPYILAVSSLSNSTARLARHARLDKLNMSNVSSGVESRRDDPSGIWAYDNILPWRPTWSADHSAHPANARLPRDPIRRCITTIYTPLRGHRRSQCPA